MGDERTYLTEQARDMIDSFSYEYVVRLIIPYDDYDGLHPSLYEEMLNKKEVMSLMLAVLA